MGVHCHVDPAEYQHSSPGEGCTGWHHCLICALLLLTHTYQTQTNPFTATPFCTFPRPCMQLDQDLMWHQRASASCFYCVHSTEVDMSIACNLGPIHIKNCASIVFFSCTFACIWCAFTCSWRIFLSAFVLWGHVLLLSLGYYVHCHALGCVCTHFCMFAL